jgi:transposase
MSNLRFIGLDVHAETIAVAVAEPDGEVRSLGVIPNRPESIQKLVKKLGPPAQLRVCYEAGPTGYVVYWQLAALEVACQVVAPSLVPVKPGDRVKTDRRDALKLAHSYRAGDLTAVWVAARTRNTYLRAQFLRLKSRRGPKKAILAVAASIVTAAYHILKAETTYHDLGPDYFERRSKAQLTRRLIRRLEELGLSVEVKPAA